MFGFPCRWGFVFWGGRVFIFEENLELPRVFYYRKMVVIPRKIWFKSAGLRKRSARGAQAPRPSPATPPLALKECLSLGFFRGKVFLRGDNPSVGCTGF